MTLTQHLDGLLIVFDGLLPDDPATQRYVDHIKSNMKVHGRPYGDFIDENTPIKKLHHPSPQNPYDYNMLAFIHFMDLLVEIHGLEQMESMDSADATSLIMDSCQVATFEGPETKGVVLSHWSEGNGHDTAATAPSKVASSQQGRHRWWRRS